MKEAGDAAEDAADGFTVAKGAAAGLIANGLTALAGAAKNAVSSLLGLASETAHISTQMDKLETGFTTAGLSAEAATDTYKNFYAVLGDEDKATEATAFLAKMVTSEKDLVDWTNIATGVYATFGDALPIEGLTEAANETAKVGQLTGVLADALNWAGVNEEDFQASLDACSTEQERQALITSTLNGLYDEASKKYQEVNADIIAANKAQAEFTEAQMKLGDKVRPITTAVQQGFTELLNAVLQLVEGVDFAAFTAKIKTAFEWITKTMLPSVITGVKWIINNLPVLATVLAGVTAGILAQKVQTIAATAAAEGLTIAQYATAAAQKALNGVMAANPIGLVIAAITALVAAFVYLWNNCESFRNFWVKTWETIKTTFTNVWGILGNFFTNTIPAFFNNLVSTGKSKTAEFYNAVSSFFQSLPGNIAKFLTTALTNVVTWGNNLVTKGRDAAMRTAQAITTEIGKLPATMIQIGGNIVDGIWKGISNGWDWLTSQVKSLAKKLLKAAKDALDINSPSKLFADQVGKNIALGIGVGYEDAMGGVSKKISGSLTALADGGAASTMGGSNAAAAGGKNIVVNQYNTYAQQHSRYELYKSKQNAAAAVKLAVMGV